ncbi:MAG: hypothetical protein ABI629_16470 [bacterium]
MSPARLARRAGVALLMISGWAAAASALPPIDLTTNRGCGDGAVFEDNEPFSFTVRALGEFAAGESVALQLIGENQLGQRFTVGAMTLSAAVPQKTLNEKAIDRYGDLRVGVVIPSSQTEVASCVMHVYVAGPGTPTPGTVTPASPTITATETPTPTPTATPTVASDAGDANCDGRLSAPDLSATLRAAAPLAVANCATDLTGDAVIDAADAAALVALLFE